MTTPATPFDNEQTITEPIVPTDEQHQLQTTSLTNIEYNVDCGETSKNFSQLCDEGIEIDDEGPAPENVSETQETNSGQWEKPRTCPRCGDINITDIRGAQKGKTRGMIALMDEMSIFWMCMPENYIIEVILPKTNKFINGEPL
ncbi:hypothetical protein ACHAW6_000315 [Cyclotella cf. meneghiniana]